MAEIIRERKAQFKKAYGLVRLLSRYAVAISALDHSWDTGTYQALRALNNAHTDIECQLFDSGMAWQAEIAYSNARWALDPYEGKTWLYRRDFEVYQRHDGVSNIPF